MSQTYDDPQDEEQTGWPYQEVQDLDPAERDELLKQAGPVGEAVRMAWIAYQASQASVGNAEPISVPPSLQVAAQPHPESTGEEPPPPEVFMAPPASKEEADDAEEEAGGGGDREAAERKADERGLEIRSFGTSGDWRVYDPSTGRQVARSKLDEPLP